MLMGCAGDVMWWRVRVAKAWRVVRRGSVLCPQGTGAARNLRWAMRRLDSALRVLQMAWDACVPGFREAEAGADL